jgi:hypothetical protein
LCLESELIGDICSSIPIIVDVDLVQDIIAEFIEIWSTCRAFQGYLVSDQGDRVGLVRADKRVDVGIVGHWIFGNLGRFAMG